MTRLFVSGSFIKSDAKLLTSVCLSMSLVGCFSAPVRTACSEPDAVSILLMNFLSRRLLYNCFCSAFTTFLAIFLSRIFILMEIVLMLIPVLSRLVF